MCVYVYVYVCVCVCVWVGGCVCVFARAFVFISFHLRGFSQLNKTVNVMSEFGSATGCCGNISVSRTFFLCLRVRDLYKEPSS